MTRYTSWNQYYSWRERLNFTVELLFFSMYTLYVSFTRGSHADNTPACLIRDHCWCCFAPVCSYKDCNELSTSESHQLLCGTCVRGAQKNTTLLQFQWLYVITCKNNSTCKKNVYYRPFSGLRAHLIQPLDAGHRHYKSPRSSVLSWKITPHY